MSSGYIGHWPKPYLYKHFPILANTDLLVRSISLLKALVSSSGIKGMDKWAIFSLGDRSFNHIFASIFSRLICYSAEWALSPAIDRAITEYVTRVRKSINYIGDDII